MPHQAVPEMLGRASFRCGVMKYCGSNGAEFEAERFNPVATIKTNFFASNRRILSQSERFEPRAVSISFLIFTLKKLFAFACYALSRLINGAVCDLREVSFGLSSCSVIVVISSFRRLRCLSYSSLLTRSK